MAKRYFVFNEGGSNKFWNIHINLDDEYEEDTYTLTVNYGKIGTDGQTSEKEFDDAERCKKEADKLIGQKLKKGYIESKDVDLYRFMGVKQSEVDPAKNEELFSIASIQEIEKELGYKIPPAYINLMKIENGDDEWRKIGDEMLDMMGFQGIDGLLIMKAAVKDWGFPNIGIYFSWTESGDHEALLMNYKECIVDCEPSIWLLDQERESGVFLAKTFEDFIRQLYFEDFKDRLDENGDVIEKYFSDWE
jgi:predicted DNA-binding WGR domain protein